MKYTNSVDFELMNNYKALLACIESEISVDKALRYIALEDIRSNSALNRGSVTRNRKNGGNITNNRTGAKQTYLIDLEEKTYKTFKSGKDAAIDIGMNPCGVGLYIQKNILYRKRYIFTRKKPENMNEIKN